MKFWVFFLAVAANSFQAVQACGSNGSTAKGSVEEMCEIPVPTDNCDEVDLQNDKGYCERRRNCYHGPKHDLLCKKVKKIMTTEKWKPLKIKVDISEAGEVIEKVRKEMNDYVEEVKEEAQKNAKNT